MQYKLMELAGLACAQTLATVYKKDQHSRVLPTIIVQRLWTDNQLHVSIILASDRSNFLNQKGEPS